MCAEEVLVVSLQRYLVTGYYDLRPIDWASGKRLPLEPGEGHVCDRCGAEHAVVFVVQDQETGEQYRVGSGCAKKNFGFDPEKDEAGKGLVKRVKDEARATVNAAKVMASAEKAAEIVAIVGRSRVPDPVLVSEEVITKYPNFEGQRVRIWRVGDTQVDQRQSLEYGWRDRDAVELARFGWLNHEVRSRIPAEWEGITVSQESRGRRTVTKKLSEHCRDLAWRELKVLL